MNFWLETSSPNHLLPPPHIHLSGVFSLMVYSHIHTHTLIQTLLYGKIRTKSIFNVCEFSFKFIQCYTLNVSHSLSFSILQLYTLYISAQTYVCKCCEPHTHTHAYAMRILYIQKYFKYGPQNFIYL